MSWKDRRRKASIGGVEFFMDSASSTFGQRSAIMRFPGRSGAFVQDLGDDGHEFSVEAFVIERVDGSAAIDYDVWRDKLEAELTRAGVKKFIHPYRGELQVYVTSKPQTSENVSQQGFASIRFDVIESAFLESAQRADTVSQVQIDAAAAKAATEERFKNKFKVTSHNPASPTGEAIGNATKAISKVNSQVNATIGTFNAVAADIQLFSNQLDYLITSPQLVASSISALINGALSSARVNVTAAVDTLSVLGSGSLVRSVVGPALEQAKGFGGDLADIFTGDPDADIESDSRSSVVRLVRTGFLADAASTISTLPFESFQQAQDVRAQFLDAIDSLVLEADDQEYDTIVGLQASLVAHLDSVAKTLPELGTYTPAITLPSLVLAHVIYGDSRREQEIVDRNRISYPGFVPQGQPLEVLYEQPS